jgi:succinoglycan biosynthesis protein ExoO
MEAVGLVPSASAKPTVSVLIAAYNAGAFLHRAVRSALAQTLPPLEVVIIDDASTDGTLDAANALAAEDSRIRVLRLPVNSGPAAARNAGLNAAKGDWVAILDADDAYMPSRLEVLTAALAERSADIVLDNFLYFDHARGVATLAALAPGNAVEVINQYDFVEHARPFRDEADWGLLKPTFRREFLNVHKLRYPDFSRHGEDFLLMFRALHAGARCILLRNPGYLYSTRDSGMSRTTIHYEAIVEHMYGLLDDPTVSSDVLLSKLLRRRIRDLRKWSAQRRLDAAREKGDYFRLFLSITTDISLACRVANSAYRKIKAALVRS